MRSTWSWAALQSGLPAKRHLYLCLRIYHFSPLAIQLPIYQLSQFIIHQSLCLYNISFLRHCPPPSFTAMLPSPYTWCTEDIFWVYICSLNWYTYFSYLPVWRRNQHYCYHQERQNLSSLTLHHEWFIQPPMQISLNIWRHCYLYNLLFIS